METWTTEKFILISDLSPTPHPSILHVCSSCNWERGAYPGVNRVSGRVTRAFLCGVSIISLLYPLGKLLPLPLTQALGDRSGVGPWPSHYSCYHGSLSEVLWVGGGGSPEPHTVMGRTSKFHTNSEPSRCDVSVYMKSTLSTTIGWLGFDQICCISSGDLMKC